MVVYTTKEGDMLDWICWKHYGTTAVVETILVANPTLTDYKLPAGTSVNLPFIDSNKDKRREIKIMGLEVREPDFSVIINGNTELIKERIVSIHTTDEAGIMSDSCDIELDDFDDALQFPKTEAKVEVSLGHKDSGLTKIGSYFVKEISIDGVRKIIKISASAVSKKMRSQMTKSHNDQSMGDLISSMAENLELDSAISDEFSDMDLEDFPQFAESNMNYLTRMSQRVGAVSKPADGHLIFAENMSGKSASGKLLETKYIDISEVAEYSCSFKETEESGGIGTIFANWYDKNAGEYHMVSSGTGDPEYELDEIFSSEKDAKTAANAKLKRVVKANKKFEFSTIGRPDFFAEHPIMLRGFSTKIPTNWITSRVEHTLSSNGFTTRIECANTLN
jgi:phage protein D/phage tail protein X